MNMNEEVIAALDDFEEALAASTSSPQEAIKVLRSYDLAHAPQEDLRKFIEIFSSSLQRLANRGDGHPLALQALWEQHETLLQYLINEFLVGCSPSLTAYSRGSWRAAIASVLANSSNSSIDAHLIRLSAIQPWICAALECLHECISAGEREGRDNNETDAIIRSLTYSTFAMQLQPTEWSCQLEEEENWLLVTQLFSKAAAPSTARSISDLCISIQNAFQATLDCLQRSQILDTYSALEEGQRNAVSQKLWQLLSAPLRLSSGSEDAWWGVYASTCHQMAVHVSAQKGMDSCLELVVATLCHASSSVSLVQCLLANPSTVSKGIKGVKESLAAAQILLQHCPSALINACCELLEPEVNAPMAVRLEAVLTIKHVTQASVKQRRSTDDNNATLLFQGIAIKQILQCIALDPSVRVRRKAMEVIALATIFTLAPNEQPRVIAAACMRCRDRDAHVRKTAYGILDDITAQSLSSVTHILSLTDWRRVLELGLEGGRASGTETEQDIAACAIRLLGRYLHREAEGPTGFLLRLQELIEGIGQVAARVYIHALGSVITSEQVFRGGGV